LLWKDKRLFRIRLTDVWCFLGTGMVSLTCMNLCYFTAMQYVTLSVASVLLYTAPAIVMLFSVLLFGEKITAIRMGALALVFGGCTIVTGVVGGDIGEVSLLGLLYGLGAGFSYAMYSIFGRFALNRGYHTFTITFYTFFFSMLVSIPFAKIDTLVMHMGPRGLLYATGMGIVCCVLPYLLYTKGLSGTDNSTASMLATLEPAVATLAGILIFQEPIAWYNLIGMVLLFAGIMVIAYASRNNT